MNRKKALVAWTVLATTLAGSGGCYQTHMGGMTLPSGHYMKDRAEYFTPAPDFPLPRELATMQRQASEAGYYNPPAARPLGTTVGGIPAPGSSAPATPVAPIPSGGAPAPAPAPAAPGGGGIGGARAPG
jgi:hypothetical protein